MQTAVSLIVCCSVGCTWTCRYPAVTGRKRPNLMLPMSLSMTFHAVVYFIVVCYHTNIFYKTVNDFCLLPWAGRKLPTTTTTTTASHFYKLRFKAWFGFALTGRGFVPDPCYRKTRQEMEQWKQNHYESDEELWRAEWWLAHKYLGVLGLTNRHLCNHRSEVVR